jgi:23S rRNA pseudouridine1911/1915/1917 synthase
VVRFAAHPPGQQRRPQPDATVHFRVVFADADVLVVDKPAGLVVHPGSGNTEGTLVNGLLALAPEIADVGDPARPGIVHRLDAGTSGLLVVARSRAAYTVLVADLAARRVGREYLALVWGHPEAPAGLIDAPVGRHPRDPTRMAVVGEGRAARTRFEVVRRFATPQVALLRCHLETGRTHQIRVHMAAAGHPIVGDGTYGGQRAQLPLSRPFLHAAGLVLHHPVSGQELAFTSPLPADLHALVDALEGDQCE